MFLVDTQLVSTSAQITGASCLGYIILSNNIIYVRTKYSNRNLHKFCIIKNRLIVYIIVSGIHYKIYDFKILLAMSVKFLKELGHKHGILATGDAHSYPVTILYKVIYIDCLGELTPDIFSELLDNAMLYILAALVGCFAVLHEHFKLYSKP